MTGVELDTGAGQRYSADQQRPKADIHLLAAEAGEALDRRAEGPRHGVAQAPERSGAHETQRSKRPTTPVAADESAGVEVKPARLANGIREAALPRGQAVLTRRREGGKEHARERENGNSTNHTTPFERLYFSVRLGTRRWGESQVKGC